MMIEFKLRQYHSKKSILYNINDIKSVKVIKEADGSCGCWIETMKNELFDVVDTYEDIRERMKSCQMLV